MLGALDKPHAKYPHVYEIVRFDLYARVETGATVVKVIPPRELDEKEAERLNQVNKGKDCIYTVQITRFVEDLET